MRKRPRTYHHGDLRGAVIDEAIRLLDVRRGGEFTVPEIARELGVTHGAVYKHFASKQEIVMAAADVALDIIAFYAEDRLPPPPVTWTHATKLAEVYVEFATTHPGLFRALFHRELEGLAPDHPLVARRALQFSRLLEAYAALLGPRRDAAARDAALAHWSLVHGFTVLYLDGQIPSSATAHRAPMAAVARLQATLEAGLRPHLSKGPAAG